MRRLCPKSMSSACSKPKYGPFHSGSTRAEPSTDSIVPGREERDTSSRSAPCRRTRCGSPRRAEQRRDRPVLGVGGQVDAVARHAVRRRIGAGEDRGARGLAQRVLRARRGEARALRGERVEPRRRAERAALDPERVGALLVGRDQQDVHARRSVCSALRGGARWKPCAPPTSDSTASPASRSRRTTSRSPTARAARCACTTSTRARPTAPIVLLHARRAVVVLPVPQDDPDARRRPGLRCIAPDLVGFGRSDKPTERTDYTYARHVEWMRAALFDAARPARRHARVPGLGRAHRPAPRRRAPRSVRARRRREHVPADRRPAAGRSVPRTGSDFSQTVEDFDVGVHRRHGLPRRRSRPRSSPAYDAPFPDDSYKAGARQFPMLVPTTPDDPASAANRKAWETLRAFDKPFLTAFSDKDPITRGGDARVPARRPGLRGPAAHDDRGRRPLPAGGLRRGSSRRSSSTGSTASSVVASTSSHCSTRCARSRRPACTTRPTRSTASGTSGCSTLDDARSTPTQRRSTSPKSAARFAPRLGYVTAKVGADAARVRRATIASCSCAASTTASGDSIAGWVDAERDARADGRARARRGGRACTARVDRLVGVFFRPARRRRQPAQHRVGRVPLLDRSAATLRAAAARSPRDRVARDRRRRARRLAPPPRTACPRRARSAHWRKRAGALSATRVVAAARRCVGIERRRCVSAAARFASCRVGLRRSMKWCAHALDDGSGAASSSDLRPGVGEHGVRRRADRSGTAVRSTRPAFTRPSIRRVMPLGERCRRPREIGHPQRPSGASERWTSTS